MSYLIQARPAADQAIRDRVTACAASLNVSNPTGSGKSDPDADETAVTNQMILTAVQELLEGE